jgi:hypothetical protein
LELPESLKIVPHDRWERVQRRLQQNIAFSPRNEKHRYLLKGLVQCGGCGARFVGDPWHGKFYYRCIQRCKRTPSISEHILNETVKEAMRNVLVNPAIILVPLRKFNEAEARESRQHENTIQVVERESKRLDGEEQRILEAYQTGVISPGQLASPHEKLKAQRATLDLQRSRNPRRAGRAHPPTSRRPLGWDGWNSIRRSALG